MPIAKVQLPDGRVATIEVPDGATEADVISFAKQNFNQPPAEDNSIKDAAIRMPVNAIASLPELAIDMPLKAGHWFGNKINKKFNRPQDDSLNTRPVAAAKDAFLKQIGVNPKSSGALENIIQSGINAFTGAGEAKLLGKSAEWLAKNPGLQTIGAVGGSFSNEAAKSMDAPEPMQIGAGLLGGLAAPMAVSAGRGIINGGDNIGKALLSDDGKSDIASRIFYKQLADPDKVIARLEEFKNAGIGPYKPGFGSGSIIKNSSPITPEIASDVGLSTLQQGFRGNKLAKDLSLDQINNARIAESDKAITDLLNAVNRRTGGEGEDILNKLDQVNSTAYSKFNSGKDLQSVPVDVGPVNAQIDLLSQRYAGKPDIERFLQQTKDNIGTDPNFQKLWNARQTVDEQVYGAKNRRDNPLAPALIQNYDSTGKAIRTTMNDSLKQADPEFEDFLRRSAFANKMSDAIRTGRALQDKMTNSGFHAAEGLDEVGAARIGANKVATNAKKLTDLAGNDTAIAEKLTPRQNKAFDDVLREINRRDALNLGANKGSPTGDILSRGGLLTDDLISSIVGDQVDSQGLLRHGLEAISKPLNGLGLLNIPERDILKKIGAAYIEPETALTMAKRGRDIQRGPLDLSKAAQKNLRAGLLGILQGQF